MPRVLSPLGATTNRAQHHLARKEPEDGAADHAEFQEKMDEVHSRAEINTAKQRHGPIDKVELYSSALLTKFDSLDKIHVPADDPPFRGSCAGLRRPSTWPEFPARVPGARCRVGTGADRSGGFIDGNAA